MQDPDKIEEDIPLSPVLSRSKLDRKILRAKRKKSKSCVNLDTKFASISEHKEELKSSSINDTFTSSQLLNIFEPFEENKLPIKPLKDSDSVFKKPLSQASPSKSFEDLKGEFKTAAGASIHMSQDAIQASKTLFSDILNPVESQSERTRKYSFLSKLDKSGAIFKDQRFQRLETFSKDLYKERKRGYLTLETIDKPKSSKSKMFKGFHHSEIEQHRIKRDNFQLFVRHYQASYNAAVKQLNEKKLSASEYLDVKSEQTINFPKKIQQTIETDFSSSKDNLGSFLTANKMVFEDCSESDNACFKLGFQTASGKAFHISAAALKEAKRLMQDIRDQSMEILEDEVKIKKRPLQNITNDQKLQPKINELVTRKEIKTLFRKDEVVDQYKRSDLIGVEFASASGKNLIPSKKASLNNKESDFNRGSEQTSNFGLPQNNHIVDKKNYFDAALGFKSAGGKSINLSENGLRQSKKMLEYLESCEPKETGRISEVLHLSEDIMPKGFQTASGKSSNVFESSLRKAQELNKIDDIKDYRKLEAVHQPKTSDTFGIEFTSASGKMLIPSKDATQKAQKLFNNIEKDFSKVSKQNSTFGLPQTNQILDKNNYFDAAQGFNSAGGKSINLSENGLQQSRKMLEYLESCEPKQTDCTSDSLSVAQNIMPGGFQSASGKSFNVSESLFRKAQKLLQEDEEDFHVSAKTVFDDIDEDLLRNSTILEEIEANSFAKNTSFGDSINPIELKKAKKLNNSSIMSRISRKKRLGMSYSKQLQISKDNLEKAKFLVNEVNTLTPQKKTLNNVFNSTPLKEGICLKPDTDITPIKHISAKPINVKTYTGDAIIIEEPTTGNINSCCKDVENEIEKLQEKTKMLSKRLEALHVQQRILNSNMKEPVQSREGVLYTKKQSINRLSLKNGLILNNCSSQSCYMITPQNAEMVHFDYTNENMSFIQTQDGALVVPSINNVVGLSEIERAFKALNDVQCNLIPEGWICNHYKWIVWKLASYQKFAYNLNGCLSVENVMQQLKYRYDREIDKAQRSTLRKIFEKDDAPQKRMILCVSNIFSASSEVRLKISCNSTRRATWYAKLGYQKYSPSFPLKINSCYPEGGQIGCVRIYIARVHPVKYKEKLNTLTVWRNQKAEDICVQEWKAKRFQETELARELAIKEHQKKQKEKQQKQINLKMSDIKSIDCPETLYNLIQQSRDPESLVESLSLEQQNTLLDHQQYLSSKTQQEINELIIDKVQKLHFSKRDVTSVLQLRVVDVLDPDKLTCTLQIWKPTESHFDMLKEGLFFDVYNIFLKTHGVLSSMNRTQFKPALNTFGDFGKFKRDFLSISTICTLKCPVYFNELDTVGIIIEMSINDTSQHVWLSDLTKSLLFIQIFDGPKNCLFLENLKPGQIVSVCNLIQVTSYSNHFAQATANHSTIFSKSSQHRHLQEAVKNFSQHVPKDLQPFLDECTAKIQTCNVTTDSNRSTTFSNGTCHKSTFYDESCDETTFPQARITSTDIMMSMMDIDQYS